MTALASIFLDFRLPTATTWFYFSLLLAVALFFKFSRVLSVRNLDVLSVFLLVPGFLLLLEGGAVGWFGYLWLIIASGVFFIRCLFDLVLVQRPALAPNLTHGGLAWLAGALYVSLTAVAVRQPGEQEGDRESPAPVKTAEGQAQHVVKDIARKAGAPDADSDGFLPRSWTGRSLALLCHFATAIGLVVISARHFQDSHAGIAAATFYLLLPYTYLLMPFTALHIGQWDHVWAGTLFVWAVACYRLPMLAGLFLGLAAGTMFFPAVVLPLWLHFYWRRGARRFLASFLLTSGVCLAIIGGQLWLQGELSQSLQAGLTDWQPWKELNAETTRGFWTRVPWAWVYRLPVFIAYVAFVATTAFWPAPKNLAHVLALSAAVLIGIQFWYAQEGGVYVLWYLPLLLLLVFRPNLAEHRPTPIVPETDWLTRFRQMLGRWMRRFLRPAQPPATVR